MQGHEIAVDSDSDEDYHEDTVPPFLAEEAPSPPQRPVDADAPHIIWLNTKSTVECA